MTVQLEDKLAGAVALAAAGDEVAFARIVEAHHEEAEFLTLEARSQCDLRRCRELFGREFLQQ